MILSKNVWFLQIDPIPFQVNMVDTASPWLTKYPWHSHLLARGSLLCTLHYYVDLSWP
jgi:hypothetical protein